MKNQFLIIAFLLLSCIGFSQENPKVKEYSYSELIQMIQAEKDTLFRLSNAKITYNAQTDSLFLLKEGDSKYSDVEEGTRKDTLHINKFLLFRDVQFTNRTPDRQSWIGFYKVKFHKRTAFLNPKGLIINECFFKNGFVLDQSKYFDDNNNRLAWSNSIFIQNSSFKGDFCVLRKGQKSHTDIVFKSNEVNSYTFLIQNDGWDTLNFYLNVLDVQNFAFLELDSNTDTKRTVDFFKNTIKADLSQLQLKTSDNSSHIIAKNSWKSPRILMSINDLVSKDIWINWNQFSKKLINSEIFSEWMQPAKFSAFDKGDFIPDVDGPQESTYTERNIKHYIDTVKIQDVDVYNAEQVLRGKFYDYYKARHEIAAANEVYIEIKDLETQRLGYLNAESPSFKTFFKWRINQFLKVFSGYGTEPERAVIFSLYVILFFAFIYLLFPNSWDTLGNRRLISRFQFFQKYLRRKEGMHTIYLEGKKEEISSFEDFKTTLENSKTELPSFFISWSKPLYSASMFSSRITSRFLQNTDILKGKWKDLSPKQKRWKNIQIGFLLTLGLVYDLFIKALNALMLSINTFTTLGFGEIPIKGLPRYLAIIQGFIGWFMLTIFSVSLISQLLN